MSAELALKIAKLFTVYSRISAVTVSRFLIFLLGGLAKVKG